MEYIPTGDGIRASREQDKDNELRRIYTYYMKYKGRDGKKRKHPSFEEFRDIIMYVKIWNIVINIIQNESNNEQQVNTKTEAV